MRCFRERKGEGRGAEVVGGEGMVRGLEGGSGGEGCLEGMWLRDEQG